MGVSAGLLLYGALVESNKIELENNEIFLKKWPKKLDGYKIVFIADLHIRDKWSQKLASRALELAISQDADVLVLGGDLIAHPFEEAFDRLRETLAPLSHLKGRVVACLGNHDFDRNGKSEVGNILREFGVTVLENQAAVVAGVTWAGIGTATLKRDNAALAMSEALELKDPIITLWHEPDMVDELPPGSVLMLAGHSHGGQFTLPGNYTPMFTDLGRKYPRGYYPAAPTPLYVNRGIGTTGPPSRLNCSPEVTVLRLRKG